MPRPKNDNLRSLFSCNNLNEIVCRNGSCGGKKMSTHAGNLERHLKHKHSELYNAYVERKKCMTQNGAQNYSVKICCTVNRSSVETAIVELFTKDGRPLRMADDRSFKIISKPVFDALKIKLNEHNVMERIIQFSTALKQEITQDCRGRLLSVKIDGATRQNLSILGINIQYIKTKTITIQTLAIKELKESHTTEFLKSMILNVLNEYEISINQILTITTDGSNMIKTVKDLNEDLKSEIDKNITSYNCGENSLESIERSFANCNTITSIRCGSHTLQQCANDVIMQDSVKDKIDKLRVIAQKLGTQTYISILKNGGYKIPIIDCITSWNSTYDMLETLHELKDFVHNLSEHHEEFIISNENWEFVSEFLTVFKVVHTATLKLQQEQMCYSDLYITIMDTLIKVQTLPPSHIKKLLLASLNKRKTILFENDLLNAAVFLDPRIRITLDPNHQMKAKQFIPHLNKRISSLKEILSNNHEECGMQSTQEPSTSAQSLQKPISLDEYLNNLDPGPNTECVTAIPQYETDLLSYERHPRLALSENVLEFWHKQNSALTLIAESVLAIPSTHVSVERLFSALAYILPDQRGNNLSPENLEHILIVRANGKFIYD